MSGKLCLGEIVVEQLNGIAAFLNEKAAFGTARKGLNALRARARVQIRDARIDEQPGRVEN